MPSAPLVEAAAGKGLLIFDYDGTLAHLAVDWEALRGDLCRRARDFGFLSTFRPLWSEMALLREEVGPEAVSALFAVLSRHESRGVRRQRPCTPIVDVVRARQRTAAPDAQHLAVFSTNLHATVAAGLAALDIAAAFAWIVGANDVTHWKPAPEGLQLIMRLARRTRQETLFIGDSAADAAVASAADVDFLPVYDGTTFRPCNRR